MPNTLEIVAALGWIASTILFVWALISLSRHGKELSTNTTALWAIGIIVFPFVGAIAWLITGCRSARRDYAAVTFPDSEGETVSR
ncbi:PLD nuclease N-terminal domain-containing protein [Arthrobacter sp. LAPM80]|uniref:PLD nuclease N-terminal domain-containing protein n=1 Tax=Arthrobacter sp. LAPM80 TaxID=3141788 RepID=UPI00398AD052